MKLSIITTIYQAEKDLPRLLDSMMAQKSPELEFFLIDNGCTDGSAAICEEYAKKDPRFVIHSLKENIGYIAARNLGLELVDADYIGFSDSDDFLEPGGYDKAIEEIKEYNPDIWIGRWNNIENDTKKVYEPPYKVGIYEDVETCILPQIYGCNSLHPMLRGFMWKQIMRLKIIRNESIRFSKDICPLEDMYFNLNFISKSKLVYISNTVLYNYILHPNSITSKLENKYDLSSDADRIIRLFKLFSVTTSNKVYLQYLSNFTLNNIITLISRVGRHFNLIQGAVKLNAVLPSHFMREVLKNCYFTNFSKCLVLICLKNRMYTGLLVLAKFRIFLGK